jgi:Flp pilus assembly protein TadD
MKPDRGFPFGTSPGLMVRVFGMFTAKQEIQFPSRHRARLLAAGLCSVLALTACASGKQVTGANPDKKAVVSQTGDMTPPQLRNAAIESTRTQDYVAAAAYWGSLYDQKPDDAEAALNYSKSLRQIGSIEQSRLVMQRASTLAPNNPEVLAEFGKSLAASGQAEQAQFVLGRASKLKPKDWTILSAQGVALDQLGRNKEAKAKYNAALTIAPGHPAILSNLGLSYALEGDLDEAEEMLRQAVADPRADAHARQNLAIVLGLKGNFDEASRIARTDLPQGVADNNIAYLRDMLSQPALWKQMEHIDGQNGTAAPVAQEDATSSLN